LLVRDSFYSTPSVASPQNIETLVFAVMDIRERLAKLERASEEGE
jgi:hypothetical protein